VVCSGWVLRRRARRSWAREAVGVGGVVAQVCSLCVDTRGGSAVCCEDAGGASCWGRCGRRARSGVLCATWVGRGAGCGGLWSRSSAYGGERFKGGLWPRCRSLVGAANQDKAAAHREVQAFARRGGGGGGGGRRGGGQGQRALGAGYVREVVSTGTAEARRRGRATVWESPKQAEGGQRRGEDRVVSLGADCQEGAVRANQRVGAEGSTSGAP
jgi:hypothetical protein